MTRLGERQAQTRQDDIDESVIGLMRKKCPHSEVDKNAAQALEDKRAGKVKSARAVFIKRCEKQERNYMLWLADQALKVNGKGSEKP